MSLTIINASSQDYKIIVNKSNETTTLSKKQVAHFFLKKKKKWSSGVRVMPVDLKGKTVARKSFSKQVLRKSIGSVRNYWQQYVFAGKGSPPVEKRSDADIVKFVKNHSGAIGYVSGNFKTTGVKEITIQ